MRTPTFEVPLFNGTQKTYQFDNLFGASVVRHDYSYGGRRGLWELAVITPEGLCYDSGITDDVIGYLTDEQVDELLRRIEALPPRPSEPPC